MTEAVQAPEAAEILERVRGLAPVFRERAAESERLRRLPDETIADAEAAGMFSLLLPRSLGGAGGGLREFVTLVRTLAQADLSASWALGFLTAHNWLLARFPDEVQEEVFRDGAPGLMALVAHPTGKAVPVDGGYELTGHWRYCSGVMHADWIVLTGAVEGREGVLFFLVPKDDAEVLDVWHMAGMQGTGSNDVRLDARFVPASRMVPFDNLFGRDTAGARLHPEPIYGYDARTLLTFFFPVMALGAAEGAIADYRQRLEQRRAAFSATIVGDTVAGQMRYARAVSELRMAQARLEQTVELTIAANANEAAGDRAQGMSHELRAAIKLDCMNICRTAWKAIEIALDGSGSSIYKQSDRTQHVVRDMHVLLSHMTIDEDGFLSRSGEILLGRATDPDPTRDFI